MNKTYCPAEIHHAVNLADLARWCQSQGYILRSTTDGRMAIQPKLGYTSPAQRRSPGGGVSSG